MILYLILLLLLSLVYVQCELRVIRFYYRYEAFADLSSYAENVANPHHEMYQQYYSKAELTELLQLNKTYERNVIGWLKEREIAYTIHSLGQVIKFSLPESSLWEHFNVTRKGYNISDVHVLNATVDSMVIVKGLQNHSLPIIKNAVQTPPHGTINPSDSPVLNVNNLASYYTMPPPSQNYLNYPNVNVLIYMASWPAQLSDINLFLASSGGPSGLPSGYSPRITIWNTTINDPYNCAYSGPLVCSFSGNTNGLEASLDAQVLIGMYPWANFTFYCTTGTDIDQVWPDWLDMDPLPHIISQSGWILQYGHSTENDACVPVPDTPTLMSQPVDYGTSFVRYYLLNC